MSASDLEKVRPNIRVEIQNNLAEAMDVDEENEEGEILDDTETSLKVDDVTEKAVFTTGINIFDKEEQEKLLERAKRFALRPEEINSFTDEDLQQLYHTLGVTGDNASNVRFKAVHLFGTNGLSTEDILDYFSKYAPSSIEFIEGVECNVVWADPISAARAMYYTSKVVKGMPVRAALPKDFDLMDEMALQEEQDILKIQKKIDFKNAVEIDEITIPIPPGYWRLGHKHPKSKCILLRYAFKTDKQPYRTENFTKYYKKIGTGRNIISASKKNEFRSIFERNKELNQDKNPWGTLARNWDEDSKFRERDPVVAEEEPKVEIKNPSILVRLGKKSKPSDEEAEEPAEEEEPQEKKKKSKIPRMRMYADEEEQKMKRKKLLQTLKKQSEKLEEDTIDRNDLRNMLGVQSKPAMSMQDLLEKQYEQVDLGLRLKNRNKKMLFSVDRNLEGIEDYDLVREEDTRGDARAFLDRRRADSPSRRLGRRSRSPRSKRSPIRRKSRERHHRRHRSPIKRTLHSDRLYSDRLHERTHRRRHSREYSDDEFTHKPRSKVAVVIKTQKKPTVASTIWSRVQKPSESDSESSESEESSESSSSSESSESEEEIQVKPRSMRPIDRPGFNHHIKSRLTRKLDNRSPLKIEIANDIC